MDLGITVTGERRLALKFETFPRRAHDRLLERITALTQRLEAAVEAGEPLRTGRLRGETRSRVTDRGDRITGRVGVSAEWAKAAALEYGAHRRAAVRAHQERLTHVFARLVAPLTVMVSAHSRQVDIVAHRMFRDALAGMREEIIAELRQALDAAAAELQA